MKYLPYILKYLKGEYYLMWCTHNPNMDQLMKICEHKLPYLWKHLHPIEPFIYLVPTKSKPYIDISLLSSPLLSPPISFFISY